MTWSRLTGTQEPSLIVSIAGFSGGLAEGLRLERQQRYCLERRATAAAWREAAHLGRVVSQLAGGTRHYTDVGLYSGFDEAIDTVQAVAPG